MTGGGRGFGSGMDGDGSFNFGSSMVLCFPDLRSLKFQ